MSRRICASAPGKVILMGEHAAVYGRPALVAAIDARCRAEVERGERADQGLDLELPDLGFATRLSWEAVEDYAFGVRQRWRSWVEDPSPRSFAALCEEDRAHLVKVALGETALALGRRPPVIALRVRSAIPLVGGFGSSAAVAVAVVAALLAAAGEEPSRGRIEGVALEVERRQHGRPSGIDHGTVLRGGVLNARPGGDGKLSFTHLKTATTGLRAFTLYDTGPATESTGEVVADVRRRFSGNAAALDPLLDRLETATARVTEWLVGQGTDRADLIADVRRAGRCLEELGVVPPPVRALTRGVEAAGGAAKISGAGSLAGPGAGALLVVWPEDLDDPPASLEACTRVPCVLGARGLVMAVEEAA